MVDTTAHPAKKTIQASHAHFTSTHEIEESDLSVVNFTETLGYVDGTPTPSSIMTQVGVEWNEHSLFVFFRGRFEQLLYETNPTADMLQKKTHGLWEASDIFSVFIGPKAAERNMYKEFYVSPDGRWLDADAYNALGISNHMWYSGFKAKSFVDEEMKIWSSIFDLPWNCFGASYDTEGEWNVNFYRASGKLHDAELLAWSPPGTGPRCFHRPECFGKIQFIFD